jgi:hypothetical protein
LKRVEQVKQLETGETCLEQTEQPSLETEVRNLKDQGKTIRESAKILHVHPSKVWRALHGPKPKEEGAPTPQGEIASRVFSLLEKGKTLPQIVITLRLEPEVVKALYDKWIEMKGNDVNVPNVAKLDEKLESHLSNHDKLDYLLEKARNEGLSKRNDCSHFNCTESVCKFPVNKNEGTESTDPVLDCVFCKLFLPRDEWVTIENPYSVG